MSGSQLFVVKPVPVELQTWPVLPLHVPAPGTHTVQPKPGEHTGVPPPHCCVVVTPFVHVTACVPLHVMPFGAQPASVPPPESMPPESTAPVSGAVKPSGKLMSSVASTGPVPESVGVIVESVPAS